MKRIRPVVAILLLLAICSSSFSQDNISTFNKINGGPTLFFDKLQKRSAELEDNILHNSEKALKKLARQEARLKKKLASRSHQQINNLDDWQQSGLVGVSKIVSLKSKMFKKTKLQLLWDFLSYQQVPRTQALKFRLRYAF